MNKVIVAGDVREGVEEWLHKHDTEITHVFNVTIACLSSKANVEQQEQVWHYCVWFYGPDGNQEDTYLDIENAAEDATETVWRLVKAQ